MVYDIYLTDGELFSKVCTMLRLNSQRYGLANNYKPDANKEEDVFAAYDLNEQELRKIKDILIENAGEVKQIRVTGQKNSFIWPPNGRKDNGLTRLVDVLDML